MLQVRRLCGGDAASFQAVRLNGLRRHPDVFGSSWEEEVDRPLDRTAELLDSGFVAGCERAGELIGVAAFRKTETLKYAHRGVVWGMYVEPDGRRLGVGRLLLSAIVERARGEVEDLILAVAAHNAPAVALYRTFGFVDYGFDRRALKVDGAYIDEILMRMAIEDVR